MHGLRSGNDLSGAFLQWLGERTVNPSIWVQVPEAPPFLCLCSKQLMHSMII